MNHDILLLPISQIKIGDRHRNDLGDLTALAASMEKGLLQPIGVTPPRELIWGYRRLVATRDILNRDQILCRIVAVDSIVQGEFVENTLRKDFSPSERVAIIESLRNYVHGGDRKSDQSRNCDVDLLNTKQAAERVGFCKDDYYRAKKVVTQGIPELVEAMDLGRLSVSAAAEIAAASPEAQKGVLDRVRDERGWPASGARKILRKTKKDLADLETKKRLVVPPGEGDIRLYHCRLQELEKTAGIEPGSVNLIATDIPYGQEFLDQIDQLGRFASRVLIDGGLFVTYAGQYWLHQVLASLGQHLTYRWCLATVWEDVGNVAHLGGWKDRQGRVVSKWKPILLFSKGDWSKAGEWFDVSLVKTKEKDWHDWQQLLSEVSDLIRSFSNPGDIVVDPLAGGFTTAVACLHFGRRCVACDVDESAVIRGQDRLRRKLQMRKVTAELQQPSLVLPRC
jgi:DNA modification methylase